MQLKVSGMSVSTLNRKRITVDAMFDASSVLSECHVFTDANASTLSWYMVANTVRVDCESC